MAEQIATRLYLDTALDVGAEVDLDEGQAHRLRNVLRLGVGAVVAGFNPRDGEFLCHVAELGRTRARLSVVRPLRPADSESVPRPEPWLVFAPIKRARLDWLVEKATELGAAALLPVWTARSQPERLNRDRLLAHAIAAAEQCERLSVPEIRPPDRLDRVLAQWPGERRLIVCDESGGGMPVATVLAALGPGPVALMVGPEGGFAETELDALGNLPFVSRVGLGPRVLRAETAGLAALAVFQAIAGDWRRARSG